MILYKDGYRFQTCAEYQADTGIIPPTHIKTDWIELDIYGHLNLTKGYAWNGADFPAINDKTNIAASAEHDALYQLIRLGLLPMSYKELADRRLRLRMRKAGASVFRSTYYELSVMLGGGHAVDPSAEKQVKVAP